MMMTDTQERHSRQFGLFDELLTLPSWSDLSEETRREVVQHLAQLLSSVHENCAGDAGVEAPR
jgi:dTDP-4-amino-4,6-dideoxygalactose transaminase